MSDILLEHIQMVSMIVAGTMIAALVHASYRKYCALHDVIPENNCFNSNTIQSAERRRARRIHAGVLLELKDETGSLVSGTAMLHDMSSNGACFDSAVVLKPNQKIQTRMRSPNDGGFLELKAQVVWAKITNSNHLYGVRFLSV